MLEVSEEHVDRAFKIARWYGRRARRAEISDLESAALEGLAKAARDWKPDVPLEPGRRLGRGRSFWTFAFKRIVGEMKDELRRFDYLSRDQRALVVREDDGALWLEEEGLKWMNPQEPLPLDATVSHNDDEQGLPIADTIEEPHDPVENLELRDAFCRAGAELPERERLVLIKRELEGYSNSEVAEALDVTEGRTSQLKGAALDQMRLQIGDTFLDAA